jgi:hypothetical protein
MDVMDRMDVIANLEGTGIDCMRDGGAAFAAYKVDDRGISSEKVAQRSVITLKCLFYGVKDSYSRRIT